MPDDFTHPPPRSAEIATTRDGRDITRGYVDGLSILPPQDAILISQGRLHDLYDEILRDDQVSAAFAQRRLAVINRPWEVVPGGERRRDRQAAEMVEDTLRRIRWDTVTERMLYARFYGYAVAELLYRPGETRVELDEIRVRNRRRFGFAPDFSLRLLTSDDPNGEALPERKFWVFSCGADHDDEPYGLGLASALYWPALFKRQSLKFWLQWADKFGGPTAVGKFQRNAGDEDKRRLLAATQSLQQDSGIIIPEDMAIELIEAARSGTQSYDALYDRMNGAISKVTLGHTGSLEATAGRLGGEDNAMEVRGDLVAADAHLIDDNANRTWVRWLTDWNVPGAAYPQVRRVLDDAPDLAALASRDQTLVAIGYRPTQRYIEQTYNVEVEPVGERTPNEGPPAEREEDESTNLAEIELPDGALEAVLRALDEGTWASIADSLVGPVLRKANEAPGELMDDLAALYPDLGIDALAETLARVLFVAEIWGRLNARF